MRCWSTAKAPARQRNWRGAFPSFPGDVYKRQAQQNPGEENAFRQLRLNQWVKQSVRWMPMDKWDACAFPVSEDDLEAVSYTHLDVYKRQIVYYAQFSEG